MYEMQEGRRGEGSNQDKVNSKWRKQRMRQPTPRNLDQDNKELDLQNHLQTCAVCMNIGIQAFLINIQSANMKRFFLNFRQAIFYPKYILLLNSDPFSLLESVCPSHNFMAASDSEVVLLELNVQWD